MLNSDLDVDEVLHISIEAMRRQDHMSAISTIKHALQAYPNEARLLYLLGAEYAQIGLFDKAEVTIQEAIKIEPSLYTAIFQLGLLQMTLGKQSEARSTWAGLDELEKDHPFNLFKIGLEQFSESNFDEARRNIEMGIAGNTFSIELNQDMQKVLSAIPDRQEQHEVDSEPNAGHVWLSAYNDSGAH